MSEALPQLEHVANHVFHGEAIKEVRRLGGLTNRTYAVRLQSGTYAFRLPGEGTEALISRYDEKVSSELADQLGIDAKLIYFDPQSGIKVSEYIKQAVTMSPESMRECHNIIDAAHLLSALHNSNKNTGIPFEVFDIAVRYEEIIESNNVTYYDDYAHTRTSVMALKDKVDQLGIIKAPCHNDPLCENWIRDPHRLYLVDWEYAGMNDPLWDLADVSIEADYTNSMDNLFLESYLGHAPDNVIRFRFSANKVFLDFLWSLWGKTRVPYDGAPMETYALDRYTRLKTNLAALERL